MNPTKLKQLEKDDLLSQWQKNQRSRNHKNEQFFIQMKAMDPWEIDRREKKMVETQIPGLSTLKSVQWNARHRRNRDINQQLENNKMMAARRNFYSSV